MATRRSSYSPQHLAPKPRRSHAFAANVRRAVTGNLARFFALFGIVAIGAGVFCGLRMFLPDTYASVDAFFDRYNFADIQVASPLGLTDDDLDAVRAVDGVRGAAGMSSYEVSMTDEAGTMYEVEVEAIDMAAYRGVVDETDGRAGDQAAISRLVLVEGRLPEAANEIVMSTNGQLKDDVVQVGDVLTVSGTTDADEVGDLLDCTTFTVVGLVQSPEWLSTSTSLTPSSGARLTNYAYVDRAALADPGLYTSIVATTDDAIDETSFSDAYDDAVAETVAAIKAIAPAREEARYQELLDQIEDGRAEAEDALATATDGRDAAQAGIDAANAVLEQLAGYDEATLAAVGQLETYQAALDALATATDALAQAEDGIAQASDALAQADEAADELELERWYVLDRSANPSCYLYKSQALRMQRICAIFPAFFFLVAALVALTTMTRMVETDRVEIGTFKALGYTRGRIALKYLTFSGLASLLGATVGIFVGVLALPRAIWTPYSRIYIDFDYITAFHQPDCTLALVGSVAVALLVTWLAVRRTLRESAASLLLPPQPKGGRRILLERVRPLWRRLPFSWKVTARNLFRYKKRMVMTVVGVAGCCALVLTGFGIQNKLDGFVSAQYRQIYAYDMAVNFDPAADEASAAGSTTSELAQALDAELGESTWGYLLKDSVIAENPDGDPADIAFGIGGKLDQTGGSVQAAMRDARSDSDGDVDSGILRDAYLYVLDGSSEQDLVLVDDYQTRERLVLPGQDGTSALVETADGRELPGVVLTERLAQQLLVDVGDAVELSFDSGDEPVEVAVSGIMYNFIGHGVYLSPEAYEAAFGEKPAYNMVAAVLPEGADEAAVAAALGAASAAVTGAELLEDEAAGYEDISTSLNSIVVILLGVSGALAFIVMYALTQINIEERRREIATLKVLGFTRREVRAYVYRETYILAAIGIAVGLPLGALLCGYIMDAAAFDNIIYFKTVHWRFYAYSAAFTALVTLVVTCVMRKQLSRIDMVSSLKSVD